MINSNKQGQPVEQSASLVWLTDVSKAAQHLTQLNLESSAQAAFITRSNELWAYAGQLSREAAQELTDSIQRYWDPKSGSDLLRFVRLQATEAQHMLYVRKLSDNMNLALVFDGETPFSTIRSQAGKLVKNLIESSQETTSQAPAASKQGVIAASAAQDEEDEDFPEIPPISELLGEVPSPNPTVPALKMNLPWEKDGQAKTDNETARRMSQESSPPVHRNAPRRPMPAMDETTGAQIPARAENDWPGSILKKLPEDMQATRKHEARFDPQSVIETRVQTVGDATIESAHRILIEPPSYYQVNLSYACLLVPRFEQHHLVGDAAARLNEWVPQICVAFGWRLEYISVRPEYLQWIVRVPLAAAAGKVIHTIRKHTSDRFFSEFPRFKKENPSGEFWAPGFIVQGGSQPHPQKQVRDFIRQTRLRQGVK